MSKQSTHKSFKLASNKARKLALSTKGLVKIVRKSPVKWEVMA